MAGIGFELQRVLRKGGIGSFLQVALAGAMITAGPWLLSVGGIFFIGRISAPFLAGLSYDVTGSYTFGFTALAIAAALGTLFLVFLPRPEVTPTSTPTAPLAAAHS